MVGIHGDSHEFRLRPPTGHLTCWGHGGIHRDPWGSGRNIKAGQIRGLSGTSTTPTTAATTTTSWFRGGGTEHLSPGGSGRAHQAAQVGQRLEGVLTRQHRHVTQATAAGAGTPEQFVDVLPLALAGELHKAQFRELSNLGARRIVAHGFSEVLEQLQLIAARLHIDEVDDHHTTDVAQLELAGNLDSRFTVGPEHRLPRIGGAGKRARVHVNHRERLGGLDDHVATGRQLHPGLEGITDGGVHLEVLKDLSGFLMRLHLQVGLIDPEEGIDAAYGIGRVHHHPHQIRTVVIAQDPMDEVLVAVK